MLVAGFAPPWTNEDHHRVITNTDDQPLAGATVSVQNQKLVRQPEPMEIQLTVPNGKLVLEISYVGYKYSRLPLVQRRPDRREPGSRRCSNGRSGGDCL
jgi:hypothetical protein